MSISLPHHERAHGLITRRERDLLRERWFADESGLLTFAWEAVKTKDEHDGSLKSLPREYYLLDHFRNFLREPIYFVLKSRQIVITWATFIALVWETLRKRYCTIALIPKKDEDGEEHIEDRIRNTIWPSLPEWVRDDFDFALTKGQFKLKQRRGFGQWDSWITSFARGGDQLRQYTHSFLFWDEMAYQAYARKSWQAAMPTIGSRGLSGPSGRVVAVSTMVPGSFHDTLMGDVATIDHAVHIAMGEMIPEDGGYYSSPGVGICHYFNKKRMAFCAVYSFLADSEKRAVEWEQTEAARLFGGVDKPEWQLDYRMNRDAFRGVFVFPHYNERWNIVPEGPVNRECEIFLSFDFGHTNPTAVLFWEWDEHEKTLTAFEEIYLSAIDAGELKQLIQHKLADRLGMPAEDVVFGEILGHNVGDPAGAGYMHSLGQDPNPLPVVGNPEPGTGVTWRINPPGHFGENRVDSGFRPSFICCGMRQYAELGEVQGKCFAKKTTEGVVTICGKEHHARPIIRLMEGRTPNLCRELPLQKRIDPGDVSLEAGEKSNRNVPNHACDALRYATMRYPDFATVETTEAPVERYKRLAPDRLTPNEAFWREAHDLVQQSIAARESFEDASEIGYASDDEEYDGPYAEH